MTVESDSYIRYGKPSHKEKEGINQMQDERSTGWLVQKLETNDAGDCRQLKCWCCLIRHYNNSLDTPTGTEFRVKKHGCIFLTIKLKSWAWLRLDVEDSMVSFFITLLYFAIIDGESKKYSRTN